MPTSLDCHRASVLERSCLWRLARRMPRRHALNIWRSVVRCHFRAIVFMTRSFATSELRPRSRSLSQSRLRAGGADGVLAVGGGEGRRLRLCTSRVPACTFPRPAWTRSRSRAPHGRRGGRRPRRPRRASQSPRRPRILRRTDGGGGDSEMSCTGQSARRPCLRAGGKEVSGEGAVRALLAPIRSQQIAVRTRLGTPSVAELWSASRSWTLA